MKSSRTMSLLIGWFVVHTAVWIGLVLLVPGDDGLDYVDLGVLGTPWVRQFIIPLLVVLALQVIVISRLGWWKPVLRDDERSSKWWMWVFPLLVGGHGAFGKESTALVFPSVLSARSSRSSSLP
ncbi:MAG: hypothetical protein ACKPDI_15875 [Actinomycetota bacterium]